MKGKGGQSSKDAVVGDKPQPETISSVQCPLPPSTDVVGRGDGAPKHGAFDVADASFAVNNDGETSDERPVRAPPVITTERADGGCAAAGSTRPGAVAVLGPGMAIATDDEANSEEPGQNGGSMIAIPEAFVVEDNSIQRQRDNWTIVQAVAAVQDKECCGVVLSPRIAWMLALVFFVTTIVAVVVGTLGGTGVLGSNSAPAISLDVSDPTPRPSPSNQPAPTISPSVSHGGPTMPTSPHQSEPPTTNLITSSPAPTKEEKSPTSHASTEGPSPTSSIPPVVTPTVKRGSLAECLMHNVDSGLAPKWTKFFPEEGSEDENFGVSVAIHGDMALVGASLDDEVALQSGAVYVFVRNNTMWELQTKLTLKGGSKFDKFGSSVAINGNTALIGAYGYNERRGSAYIFIRSHEAWIHQATLLPDADSRYAWFGINAAFHCDTALVAAPSRIYSGDESFDDFGDSGTVYIFSRTGASWKHEAKLRSADNLTDDEFGCSVSIYGDTALIGASKDVGNGLGSGAVYVFLRSGTTWKEQAKLISDDGKNEDYFGASVALDGNTAVVGAFGDSKNKLDIGSAYVFFRTGTDWELQAQLLPAVGSDGAYFGGSVAIDGNTIVIGADGDNDNGSSSGSAYVFLRTGTTWKQQDKLLPDDGKEHDKFGNSVAVQGNTAIIAGWGYNNNFRNGVVYAIDCIPITLDVCLEQRDSSGLRDIWTKLLAKDASRSDEFGYSVAVDGNRAVIGARNDDGSGSVYVFLREGTTWGQQSKLLPEDGSEGSVFGTALAVDGNTIVVGAIGGQDANGVKTGAAYVFFYDGTKWEEQAKLIPNDGSESDYFGRSVALDGDTALIGSELDDDNGRRSGSAYAFVRSDSKWNQEAKLLPDDGSEGECFGCSVAIDGDTAVIGARYAKNEFGKSSGSAYVFVRALGAWKQQEKLGFEDRSDDDKYFGRWFGASVAIWGDTAVIGASQDRENDNSGSVYVFLRTGVSWKQQAKLLPDNLINGEFRLGYFGESVALHSDVAIIGAPRDGENGEESGAVFVFVRTGASWSQEVKLLPNDGSKFDGFGSSVAFDGKTVVSGSFGDDGHDGDKPSSGSAYIFTC